MSVICASSMRSTSTMPVLSARSFISCLNSRDSPESPDPNVQPSISDRAAAVRPRRRVHTSKCADLLDKPRELVTEQDYGVQSSRHPPTSNALAASERRSLAREEEARDARHPAFLVRCLACVERWRGRHAVSFNVLHRRRFVVDGYIAFPPIR